MTVKLRSVYQCDICQTIFYANRVEDWPSDMAQKALQDFMIDHEHKELRNGEKAITHG